MKDRAVPEVSASRPPTLGARFVPWLFAALVALSLQPLSAQAPTTQSVDEVVAPSDLGTVPFSEMSALMEVTIFNIDVLTLTVRVGPQTADVLRRAVEGRSYSEEIADTVAAVVLRAHDLWSRQVLHRDVSLGRLTGGIRETVDKAAQAGFVSTAYAQQFSEGLPDLYGFLEADGAKKDDEIFLLVRGDSVRTVYRSRDGQVLLDRVGVDPDGRNASVPSFFAPGTRFRRRLVESLLAQSGR